MHCHNKYSLDSDFRIKFYFYNTFGKQLFLHVFSSMLPIMKTKKRKTSNTRERDRAIKMNIQHEHVQCIS